MKDDGSESSYAAETASTLKARRMAADPNSIQAGEAGQDVTVKTVIGPAYVSASGTEPRIGSAFDRALIYASAAHHQQRRKGGTIPYLSHLISVASLVLDHGGDETQAIAALLHDCLEDCGREHEPLIEEAFGGEVLAIVRACSDADVRQGEDKPPWRERKAAYLAHLNHQPASVLLVSCCDKLHNARAILSDLRQCGPTMWERFNEGEAEQLWYYGALADTFAGRVPDVPARLVDELRRTVFAIKETAARGDGEG